MRYSTLISFIAFAHSVIGEQLPFDTKSSISSDPIKTKAAKKRPLTGRFLHLTDFHPDPHYVAGATYASGCHRRPGEKVDSLISAKGKERATHDDDDEVGVEKTKDIAGYWGSGVSDCDAPMSLVNLTFSYLAREWADKVDFVIWTGDSARHDIDRAIPRTTKEIFELNRMMVAKMEETFGKDVVIVPSIGNNDIYPHNVLAPGPNSITSEFLRIWKNFIPQDSRHIFERGAYFSVEVIPDRLAVISLNTLYWYDSNTLVDGCRDRSSDPGAKEMDWLEVQLSEFRDRGMQVWMSGHVPPHMGHYFDNCYLRYGDLALRYQDTIVGHLFGHMNVDHFFFIDVQELESTSNPDFAAYHSNTTIPIGPLLPGNRYQGDFTGPDLRHGPHLPNSGRYRNRYQRSSSGERGGIRVTGRKGDADLGDELRKDFRDMPGAGKIKLKDYAVMNVAPSVIPTYLPSVRVFTYNITGIEREFEDDNLDIDSTTSSDGSIDLKKKRKGGHRHHLPKSDCSRPENEDKPHCVFKNLPRYYSKHSPSRSNHPLTPLGYAQFYLPDVDCDESVEPTWEVEYTTYKVRELLPSNWSSGVGTGEVVPLHLLPGYEEGLFNGTDGSDWLSMLKALDMEDDNHDLYEDDDELNGIEDGGQGEESEIAKKRRKFIKKLQKITPWKMNDLTINSYVKLSRKLVAQRKMWDKFAELMFVSSSK